MSNPEWTDEDELDEQDWYKRMLWDDEEDDWDFDTDPQLCPTCGGEIASSRSSCTCEDE